MFILDATTKSLKANLTAAATTTNPDFATAWADSNGSTFTGGSTDGAFNGTTDVTLAAAPSSGNQRYIKFARIHNRDSAAVTVNIKYDNNGTQRIVQRVTLGSGETWTPDASYDAFGNMKSGVSSSTSITISNITGYITPGVGTALTITGLAFFGVITVRFNNGAGTIADVSVTPTSNTSLGVTVPASIYNLAAGTAVTIQLIDSAARVSNVVTNYVTVFPTGGIITVSNGYRYHKFISSGTFTINSSWVPAQIEYLCVAGGGASGSSNGAGGGGGGGLRQSTAGFTANSYTITVGAGGTASSSPTVRGGNGGDSSIIGNLVNVVSLGGGGSGGESPSDSSSTGVRAGAVGGSGGGGIRQGVGGLGTAGQGNAGGSNVSDGSPYYSGGGGGGAGAAGTNGSASVMGTGGNGLQFSVWAAATSSGADNGYYAGGGGTGAYSGTSAGTGGVGGLGGGKTGGSTKSQAELNGVENTGGGGAGHGSVNTASGNGGSGIVLLRYIFTG